MSISVNQTFEISIGTQKVQLTLSEIQELSDNLNRILGKNIKYPIFPEFPIQEMPRHTPKNPAWPKRPGKYEVWCNETTTKSDSLKFPKEFGE
jgi:hypothetical protein